MLKKLEDLVNPHGTATRLDLVIFMQIIMNVLTGRPEDCWTMESDLINHLNSQPTRPSSEVQISPEG